MKNALLFLLVCMLPLEVFGQQEASSGQTTLVFTHVTVIDATGAPAKLDMTVVIKGGRIAALGKTGKLDVPDNAHVVDATGKFLIPGLWDMHAHPHENDAKEYLSLFIANGVTSMRVMWGIPEHHKWREEILAGELLGPRMFISRNPIEKSKEEMRQAVRKAKSDGADFIKIGNQDVPRDTYFAMADEANKLGFPFTGHIPYYVTLAEASDAGLHTLEHTVFFVFASSSRAEEEIRPEGMKVVNTYKRADRTYNKFKFVVDIPYSEEKAAEILACLVKSGTWVCPNLITRSRGAGPYDPRFKYLPVSVRDRFEQIYILHQNKDVWHIRQKLFEKNVAVVGAMHDAGVGLLAGTDTFSPGLDLQDELVFLVQAGLSPMEALQTATYNAAKCMGLLDTIGTIERGKIADLVLLDADPLQDIGNTQKIAAVVLGGEFFDKPALQKIFAQAEAREALHQAAVDGDIEQVKSLISKGADVNATSTIRWTPLQYAASEGHREIVELLLAHDADVNLGGEDNMTAAEYAIQNSHTEILQLLISKGADISPLHVAISMKDEAEVRSLIEGGADVHELTPGGLKPIRRAAFTGFTKAVEILLANGADVNDISNWNWTLLHGAAENGHKEIVELLIAKGAKVNVKDRDGRTPLFYAKDNGHTEIVEILRKHGAKE